jgi:hypothetical protein
MPAAIGGADVERLPAVRFAFGFGRCVQMRVDAASY